jgi:F0F1-type ATP synthase membrane subunit c/vacuolar-type H+-ATPase subunit K
VVALAIDIVAALGGAFGAGLVAVRLTRRLARHPRGRIARRVVALLGGLAGAEIATQLVELVQQLELDDATSRVFGGTAGGFDAFDVATAFREVLFTGALLVGLAALVAVAAMRRYRVASD